MLPPPLPQPRTFSLSPFKTAPPPPHQELFAFTTVLPLLTLLTPPSTTSLFSRLPSPPITPSLMHPSILSLFLTHNIPSLSSTSLIYLPLLYCFFLGFLAIHLQLFSQTLQRSTIPTKSFEKPRVKHHHPLYETPPNLDHRKTQVATVISNSHAPTRVLAVGRKNRKRRLAKMISNEGFEVPRRAPKKVEGVIVRWHKIVFDCTGPSDCTKTSNCSIV
ncbi:hypothetical protein ACSQ67_001084 [Phaseolus vulgaris]